MSVIRQRRDHAARKERKKLKMTVEGLALNSEKAGRETMGTGSDLAGPVPSTSDR